MGLTQTIPPTAEPIHLDEAKDHLRVVGSDDDADITRAIAAATRQVEAFLGRQLVTATWELKMDAFPRSGDRTIWVPHPPLHAVSSITYVDSDGDTQTLATTGYTVDATSLPPRIVEAYGETWPTTRSHIDAVTVTYLAGYATPFTAAVTDILTWLGRSPTDEDSYVLQNSGGALPAGLSPNTLYYVRDTTGATCKLETSVGGGAIDITDTGTGTHFVGVVPEHIRAAILLRIGNLFENREAQQEGRLEDNRTAAALLWPDRVLGAL